MPVRKVLLASCSVIFNMHIYKLIRLAQPRFNRPIVVVEGKTEESQFDPHEFSVTGAWCSTSLQSRWLMAWRGVHRDLSQAAPLSSKPHTAGEAVKVEVIGVLG